MVSFLLVDGACLVLLMTAFSGQPVVARMVQSKSYGLVATERHAESSNRTSGCVWKKYPGKSFSQVSKASGFHLGMAKKACANGKCAFTCQSASKKAWCHIGRGELQASAKAVTWKCEQGGQASPKPAAKPAAGQASPKPAAGKAPPKKRRPPPTSPKSGAGTSCTWKRYPGKSFSETSTASGFHLGMAKKACAKGKCAFTCQSASKKAWCHIGRGELKDSAKAVTWKCEEGQAGTSPSPPGNQTRPSPAAGGKKKRKKRGGKKGGRKKKKKGGKKGGKKKRRRRSM